MFRAHLPLGHARQIELDIHLGWLLTVLVITYLLGQALFPRLFPGWMPSVYWGVAATIAVTDGLAALIHELGHASVALARGRRVYHITLYGLVASVRRCGSAPPRDQLLIAVAGPLSHLLLASAFWAMWQVLPLDNEPLRVAAAFPAVSNWTVGVLNLLPFLPLDGGRAVRALLASGFRF